MQTPPTDHHLRRPAVIVLDDDPDIAQVLRIRLERDGFNVITAPTLGELEAACRRALPAAVVVDLNLGCHDGLQASELLAKLRFRGPVFLMSGSDERVIGAARRHGETLGLSIPGIFHKPFSLSMLSAAIRASVAVPDDPDASSVAADIKNGIIRPYFQVQVDLATGKIVGAEALARRVPFSGAVGLPGGFLPIVERAGLWCSLTERILADTAKAIEHWRESGISPCKISVNLAAVNASDPDFGLTAASILNARSVDPKWISFEVTEQTAMSNTGASLRALTWLRIKGFDLSLDDFGTGFSSLSVLHAMPFCELKIDRSFVQRIGNDRDARVIVKTTIDLAHNLGLLCVAEGIEDEATCAALAQMGCDRGQGYLFGKAVDAATFGNLLKSGAIDIPCKTPPAAT
ncbi:EAL domain-containing protein [Oleomonas cavernae]|nr:EAL domain-containing protein [Oleomonas cavernae]